MFNLVETLNDQLGYAQSMPEISEDEVRCTKPRGNSIGYARRNFCGSTCHYSRRCSILLFNNSTKGFNSSK